MTKKPNSKDTIPPDYRPFLRMGTAFDTEFKYLLERLVWLIREHGIFHVKPDPNNKENYKSLMYAVHDGWKLAQTLIADKIISNLKEIESLEKLKNQHHRSKNNEAKKEVINTIGKLAFEIRTLRRFIDAIVWTMLNYEHSTIRRLPLSKNTNNLSVANILDGKKIIEKKNSDPATIAIISDITSFVHTGDIIQLSPEEGLQIIEVKSGDKNYELCKAAQRALEEPTFESTYISGMSDTDKEHYQRAKRQAERAANLREVFETGQGYDSLSGLQVKIEETSLASEFFTKEIVECRQRLEENGIWAIAVIDDCLHVGMYKDPKAGYLAYNLWMESIECKSRVYNINDSFRDALARPLLALDLPTRLVTEILTGKVTFVACLDIAAFYKLTQRVYPNAIELKKATKGTPNDLMIDGMVLTIQTDSGRSTLGDGLITRMIFDLHKPSNIIDMMLAP